MSKLFHLSKIIIKNNLLSQFSSSNNKQKKKGKLASIILIIFLFSSLLLSTGIPLSYAIQSIVKIEPSISRIFIGLLLPVAGIMTIVFNVFGMTSVFYFSKDSDYLLPLPIRPKDLMMAKFIASIFSSYLLLILFVLPVLVGVGIGSGAGIIYYIYSISIFIILPIIPSIIICYVIMLLMSIFNIGRNKDRFMYLSTIFIIVVSLAYSFISQSLFTSSLSSLEIIPSIQYINQLISPYFKMIFPFFNSAVDSIIYYGDIYGLFAFITFLGINIFFLSIFYLSGEKLYIKGVTKTSGSSKKSKLKKDIYAKISRAGSFLQLLNKEWIMIKRTPAYMLNLVSTIFIVPLVMIVSFFMGINAGNQEQLISEFPLEFINDSSLLFTAAFIFLVFISSTTPIAVTSISREGKNAWFMKIIPASYFKQLNTKVFLGFIVSLTGIILISIIPIVIFKISFLFLLLLFLPLSITLLLINYLGIIIDLKRPYLSWSNETEAVKQNINVLISILISFIICGLVGILIYLEYSLNMVFTIELISLIITVLSLISLYFTILYIKRNQNYLFEKIN